MKLDEARHEALRALVARLGLAWRDEVAATLHQALTHASYAKENPGTPDNERLELLGDAVLGLLAVEVVFEMFPHEQEGDLSKRRHSMVSRKAFGEIGTDLGLGALIIVGGSGEDSNIRENANVLGSVLEAVVGALHLHYDWYELKGALRGSVLAPALAFAAETPLTDFKTLLQQECHAQKLPAPEYTLVEQSGPPHERVMTVEVAIGNRVRARASATRKRDAEQEAARQAIEQMRLAE